MGTLYKLVIEQIGSDSPQRPGHRHMLAVFHLGKLYQLQCELEALPPLPGFATRVFAASQLPPDAMLTAECEFWNERWRGSPHSVAFVLTTTAWEQPTTIPMQTLAAVFGYLTMIANVDAAVCPFEVSLWADQ